MMKTIEDPTGWGKIIDTEPWDKVNTISIIGVDPPGIIGVDPPSAK